MSLNQTPFTGSFAGNIESRVHGLRVILSRAKGASTTGQDLLDELTDVTIKVDKGTPNGIKTKIYKISLLDIMTVCIPEGGFVSADVIGANLVVKGSVIISRDGAEHLQDNEYYKVTVEGLPDGVSGDLYVLDSPIDAQLGLSYSLVRVTANAPRITNIAEAQYIAIPKDGLNQLDLQYQGSSSVTYLPEELEYITEVGLPQGFLVDGNTKPGGGTFYIIPVGRAVFAKVDSDSDMNIVIINEQGL